MSRREALSQTGLLTVGAAFISEHCVAVEKPPEPSQKRQNPFRYCLNTATIRGQKIGILKELEVASKAGYQGIEPWIGSVEDYLKGGGTLKELKQRVNDSGLTVESAIGFSEWIVDDENRRTQGLEKAKREMEMLSQLGAKRLAAPPAGATGLPKLDLLAAAERYRALLEAGERVGVIPQLELWGFSKNLNRLGECVCVAIETGHAQACVLADIYHIYKGGSDFRGMALLGPNAIQVLHMNDFPSDPPRDKIDDSYRVYPGDGVAPLKDVLRLLRNTGGESVLSLEVFNRKYWTEDPLEVARTGLAKMKAAADTL